MNSEPGTGFIPGLLLGGAINAAVALLYAPHPGTETRRLVKEKALKIREKAAQAVSCIEASAGSVSSPQS